MGQALLLGVIAILLLLGSGYLWRRSRHGAASEALLAGLAPEQQEIDSKMLSRFEKEQLRLGVTLPAWVLMLLISAWLLLLFIIYALGGLLLLVLVFFGSILLVRVVVSLRYRRRVKKMVSQLPQMLDHMVRSVKSGRTLNSAVILAMETAGEPLHTGLGRSRRFIERGGRLDDALDDFADLYQQYEFKLLAMGIRINQRYGGSSVEVLQNIAALIREREIASAQLKAMTGETRMSALVLGGMPVAMAGYIFFTNPDFLLGLWQDPTGKLVLMSALTLQAIGSFLLWRMLRSV